MAIIDYKADLDNAGYAIRDKVGQVLSSGSKIISYRDRATAYLGSSDPKVVSLAQAVVSKATGLLANYQTIEADSITATGNANALRAKMDTDPTWQAILTDPVALMASAGWGAVSVINGYIQNAVTVTAALVSVASRADKHLSAVDDLSSNADDLDNFAQGKGLSAKLASITSIGSTVSGLLGQYLTFAEIAAGAVGLFFVWDLAKPFVTAKKVYSNPRRSRRGRR